MQTLDALLATLRQLDGRGYRDYKRIRGDYDAGFFRLRVDHPQGDPFAEASRVRAFVPAVSASLPDWSLRAGARREATADFLNRTFLAALDTRSKPRGSGSSGALTVLRPGQQVLVRSSIMIGDDGALEARFRIGLPARGRTILGHEAAAMIGDDVTAAVREGLLFASLDAAALRLHVEAVEDARALRAQLAAYDLVAFVADDAHLPRRSGIDDRPLDDAATVPFRAPDSLRVTLHAPNAGDLTGMGIRRGITLIVGGGFHGKSTLLRALERGVHDHIPGDGRERVVTALDAVKVRAEDGRAVAGTDITNFIGHVPGGARSDRFTTPNASGSTSQAAAIIEALESGARALLIDEDTSATNFMIRDARMQALIADRHEPITPFIDRARQLADEHDVSSIVVIGGSGDYFDIADCVIALREYVPDEVTTAARDIAARQPTGRRGAGEPWQAIRRRAPLPQTIDPSRGHRNINVRAPALRRAVFGEEEVDLSAVEQLVERAQARAIALAIATARDSIIDGHREIGQVLKLIMRRLAAEGLDAFQGDSTGELAAFRVHELAAFLNRLRSLRTASV